MSRAAPPQANVQNPPSGQSRRPDTHKKNKKVLKKESLKQRTRMNELKRGELER